MSSGSAGAAAADAANKIADEFRKQIAWRAPEFRGCRGLVEKFKYCSLPAIPLDNYPVALIVFRVLFEQFSYAKDRFTAASPPKVNSVFMFILELKGRLRFLQIILKEMCKSSCHCDALFAVFAENVEKFKERSSFTENYMKYFFLRSMMMIRIFQHKYFPAGGDRALVLLCPDVQREVVEKIEQKSGFKFPHDRHRHVRNYLGEINKGPNEHHSRAIQRLLRTDPSFFSTWFDALSRFFSRRDFQYDFIKTEISRTFKITMHYNLSFESMRSKKAEKYWIRLMEEGCPELFAEFKKHSIENDTISWIFYWFFYQRDFPGKSFSDVMSNLVQPGKMSFPSPQPPKIFSDNCGSRRQETGLSGFPFIPANNVLEICGSLDYPELLPSAKVLATSFRRRLDLQKGNRMICEGLFKTLFRPINLKFFVGFAKIDYRNLHAINMLSHKYALEKQNPVLRKYLSRCLDSKNLLQLKNLQFWKMLIRKMVYPCQH
jgi:hypothetical protein